MSGDPGPGFHRRGPPSASPSPAGLHGRRHLLHLNITALFFEKSGDSLRSSSTAWRSALLSTMPSRRSIDVLARDALIELFER